MLVIGQELIHPINKDTAIFLGVDGEPEIPEHWNVIKYRGEVLHLTHEEFIFEPIRDKNGKILVGDVVFNLGLEGNYFGMINEKYWEYIPDRINELIEKFGA